MTELTFLLEILLNHKLQKPTKDLILNRIKEIESSHVATPTQRPRIVDTTPMTIKEIDPATQNATVAKALLDRQKLIADPAANTEPGRTSPRKF